VTDYREFAKNLPVYEKETGERGEMSNKSTLLTQGPGEGAGPFKYGGYPGSRQKFKSYKRRVHSIIMAREKGKKGKGCFSRFEQPGSAWG